MYTLTKLPTNPLYLSGNPIIVEATGSGGYSYHYFCIRVTTIDDVVIGVFKFPFVNSKVSIDISSYLKIDFKNHFTIDTLSIVNKHTVAYQFIVGFFEMRNLDGIEYNPQNMSIRVLQGKLSNQDYDFLKASGSSFYSYFIYSQKKFLTFQPDKTTYTDAIERLYFFLDAEGSRTVTLNVEMTFSNGTGGIFGVATTTLESYTVYEFCVDYNSLGIIAFEYDDVVITSYKIYLSSGGNAISEVITYTLDRNYYKYKRSFVFLNSLGMYDFITTKGVSSIETSFARETGTINERKITLNSEYTNSKKISFKWLNSIYKNAARALAYMTDFALSKDMREIINGFPVPSFVTSKKIVTQMDNQFLVDVEFEMETQSDSGFSNLIDSAQMDNNEGLPLVIKETEYYVNVGGGLLKYM